jgi:hypothetical protein
MMPLFPSSPQGRLVVLNDLYFFPDFGLLLWPPVGPGSLCLDSRCYAQ